MTSSLETAILWFFQGGDDAKCIGSITGHCRAFRLPAFSGASGGWSAWWILSNLTYPLPKIKACIYEQFFYENHQFPAMRPAIFSPYVSEVDTVGGIGWLAIDGDGWYHGCCSTLCRCRSGTEGRSKQCGMSLEIWSLWNVLELYDWYEIIWHQFQLEHIDRSQAKDM